MDFGRVERNIFNSATTVISAAAGASRLELVPTASKAFHEFLLLHIVVDDLKQVVEDHLDPINEACYCCSFYDYSEQIYYVRQVFRN